MGGRGGVSQIAGPVLGPVSIKLISNLLGQHAVDLHLIAKNQIHPGCGHNRSGERPQYYILLEDEDLSEQAWYR